MFRLRLPPALRASILAHPKHPAPAVAVAGDGDVAMVLPSAPALAAISSRLDDSQVSRAPITQAGKQACRVGRHGMQAGRGLVSLVGGTRAQSSGG